MATHGDAVIETEKCFLVWSSNEISKYNIVKIYYLKRKFEMIFAELLNCSKLTNFM